MHIYKITNIITNKVYIGLDGGPTDKHTRWKTHKSIYKNYKHKSKLYSSIRKHGIENFHYEVIYESSDINDLYNMEYYYIKKYNAVDNGYNILIADLCFSKNLSKEDLISIKEKKREGSIKANKIRWESCIGEDRKKFIDNIMKQIPKDKRSKYTKKYWDNISDEEYELRVKSINDYWDNISDEERKVRYELSKENFKKASLKRSNKYKIISPNEIEYIVTSIPQFSKEHNLSKDALYDVSKGYKTNYKGWKVILIEKAEISTYIKKTPITLINPKGKEIVTDNLKQFCKDNNLSYSSFLCIKKGLCKQHNGWTILK
jgi:hypothetical protein